MKHKLLFLLFMLAALPALAQNSINLTPRAKSVTGLKAAQRLTLPQQFVIATAGQGAEAAAEAQKFADVLLQAAGLKATVADEQAGLFTLKSPTQAEADQMGQEGYRLVITDQGLTLSAATTVGYYYGFQTIKKMLPANVMAGVADAKVTDYSLPTVTIADAPRFPYRGFMLDCSRHFYTVKEIKRMLDVMSYYKMNRFHWHLTDDQGWRAEIKQYPKLTEVGSISPNTLINTLAEGKYWLNKPYGPYFYTQDEMRELVAYAKQHHIEVVPEIEVPGHMQAAIASYPWLSCNPGGDHTIWSNGGISSDVLNVANPEAVQFVKNVLGELVEIFPYHYFHVGGDETPTSAWAGNADCQALKAQMGWTNDRALQSYFTKEISDFLISKGRTPIFWNESIADGSDLSMVKSTGALIMCWTGAFGAAKKAATQLGLDCVYTPWRNWYINTAQSNAPGEPSLAGDGSNTVQVAYNDDPTDNSISAANLTHYKGVQGTFWCEHVSDINLVEYAAMPRLQAIAEVGWTPKASKNWQDFRARMNKDTLLLNYNGYHYGRHIMDQAPAAVDKVMPKAGTYYRLVTRAQAPRADRCLELYSSSNPQPANANNKAADMQLWTNTQAAEGSAAYPYQQWTFEEDPSAPGHYAMVCQALPDGSVSANPSAKATSGRWSYDPSAKHYNFLLATHSSGYGFDEGGYYYYTIESDQATGGYINAALGGQQYAANWYNNPVDGNGGLWTFEGGERVSSSSSEGGGQASGFDPFPALQQGQTVRIAGSTEEFQGSALVDAGAGTQLRHSADPWAANAWTVLSAKENDDHSQTVTLQNAATGKKLAAINTNWQDRLGFQANIGASAAQATIIFSKKTDDFTVSVGGKKLYPLPGGRVYAGNNNSQGGDAIRSQGAAWTVTPVCRITYQCQDEQGNPLGTFTCTQPAGKPFQAEGPQMKNLEPISYNGQETLSLESLDTDQTLQTVYRRVAYSLTIDCRDQHGAIIERQEQNVPVGQSVTLQQPAFPYYQATESDFADGATLTPEADLSLTVSYQTEAYSGVRQVADLVTKPQGGHSYLIYDACQTDAARTGFRRVLTQNKQVNRSKTVEGADPTHTWTLVQQGTAQRFKVKNEYMGLYVPSLVTQANPTVLSTSGESFSFTLNSDGETFRIQGQSNQVCWDGVANGNLVGWNAPGHPMKLYEYFVQPMFEVEVIEQDAQGKELGSSKTFVVAGEPFTPTASSHAGLSFQGLAQGEAEQLAAVGANLTVHLIYADPDGINAVGADASRRASGLYDLSGRRLQSAQHPGLYIVDGQKVMLRK